MQQLQCFGDQRTLAFCAFCGGNTGTRDHCPSKVFLDEPYPENLPVVPACFACNTGFSIDEEYLACLVSCVIAGSTDPELISRAKVSRILKEKPALRAKLESARSLSDQGCNIFSPEHERVSSVLIKLAQGHALYELHESRSQQPDEYSYMPLELMSDLQRKSFEIPESYAVWPEVGSRAMQRLVVEGIGTEIPSGAWLDVQPGHYRFRVSLGNGLEVRIVIHEYLACYVHWN
jgi:hypothetical protein